MAILLGGPHQPRGRQARGIVQHDLVRLNNDRGGVICAAKVTERVRPGMVHSYESSAMYDPVGDPGRSDDHGGCVNTLTPSRLLIERSHSIAANSCLVQVEKCRRGRDELVGAAGASERSIVGSSGKWLSG